jgi:hypothetical protein
MAKSHNLKPEAGPRTRESGCRAPNCALKSPPTTSSASLSLSQQTRQQPASANSSERVRAPSRAVASRPLPAQVATKLECLFELVTQRCAYAQALVITETKRYAESDAAVQICAGAEISWSFTTGWLQMPVVRIGGRRALRSSFRLKRPRTGNAPNHRRRWLRLVSV